MKAVGAVVAIWGVFTAIGGIFAMVKTFLIIGLVITIYGAMTMGDPMYTQHSLGINMNLWWGLVLTAFGALMLVLTFTSKEPPPEAASKH